MIIGLYLAGNGVVASVVGMPDYKTGNMLD